jgi:hypothetical protein
MRMTMADAPTTEPLQEDELADPYADKETSLIPLVYRFMRERDPNYPDDDFGATSKIRRRLFAGEGLTSEGIERDYGTTRSLLGVITRIMKAAGYKFHVDRSGPNGTAIYRLTNPEHVPPPDFTGPPTSKKRGPRRGTSPTPQAKRKRALRDAQRGLAEQGIPTPPSRAEQMAQATMEWVTRQGRKPAAHGTRHAATPQLPELGSMVQVAMLLLQTDGTVQLALRNGDSTVLCKVEGVVES